ncbi:uncharacterized protein LOC126109545 [Schistocerca cancellata]|uniref:uncharacterized protein LOC126109545 n=1 Tax=Schistocerca cancellata TaxID=274614 RepID=UPI0021188AFA|nr:uncharacterized protein LOC126109545 [Schistocerca cancellata]
MISGETEEKVQIRLYEWKSQFQKCNLNISKTKRVKMAVNRDGQPARTSKLDRVGTYRLRWYGHVMRMEPTRTTKLNLKRQVDGKSPQGRPHSQWMDLIKADLVTRGWTVDDVLCEQVYLHRMKWKRLITSTQETGTVKSL